MEVQPQEIREYVKSNGMNPFREWLHSLEDSRIRAQLRVRLNRIRLGNFGDFRSVGDGVYEFRISIGPGYRIYFGKIGKELILLLGGGEKNSQTEDIMNAKKSWQEYKRRSHGQSLS